MTLQRLLGTAFKNGCGITVEHAMRTPRYQELKVRAATVKVKDPAELALVQYLGERLADRAAKNLPITVKHSLHLWDEGLEAQKQLLAIVMRTMTTSKWQKYGDRKRTHYRRTRRDALPAVTKSWERGPVQPNCLGMTQMLIGMARLLGANHYMINVLRTEEESAAEFWNSVYKEVLEELEPYQDDYHMRQLKKEVLKLQEKMLIRLAGLQQREAHHALAIQLSDGKWWIVDPYLSVMHELAIETPRAQKHLQAVANDPRMTMVQYAPRTKNRPLDLYKPLHALLDGFAVALTFMRKDLEEEEFKNGLLLGLMGGIGYRYAGVSTKVKYDDIPEDQQKQFNIAFNALYERAMLPAKRREEIVAKRRKGSKVRATIEELKRYDAEIMRNRVAYRRAFRRMIRGIAVLAFDEVYLKTTDKQLFSHPLLEFADPATMLGCATLNHLRAKSGTHVHGRLMLYTSSQWILYDTLAAEKRGDWLDAESSKAVSRKLKKIVKSPKDLTQGSLQVLLQTGS